MRDITLTPRLQTIADMVRQGINLVDVGCDHAYLVCYLVQKDIIDSAIACDINELPLRRAKENIEAYGLQKRIRTVLSNGLENIPEDDADDIVIAGMGAETIMQIIDDCKYLQNPSKRLLLQPMTKHELMREYLYQKGFEIVREKAVCEQEHDYTVILARWCGQSKQIDDVQKYIGAIRFNNTKEDMRYIVNVAKKLFMRARGCEQASDEETQKQAQYWTNLGKEIAWFAQEEYEKSIRDL